MTKFSISAELESFLPSTTEDEKKALRLSLQAEGCLQPLTVWAEEQVLVDGHNRYRICVDEGIPFTVTERNFPGLEAVKEWMLLQQLCRRNLSDNHRRWCLGQLYERRKGEKGGDRKSKPQNGALIPKGSVRNQIANETGSSKNTVERSATFTRTVEALAKAALPAHGNHAADAPLPMRDPLARVLVAVFAAAAPTPKRPAMLRPRPPYLPHPCRRLPRLPGVIRPNLKG